jgi:hypothetical protein
LLCEPTLFSLLASVFFSHRVFAARGFNEVGGDAGTTKKKKKILFCFLEFGLSTPRLRTRRGGVLQGLLALAPLALRVTPGAKGSSPNTD